ncbi:MAG: hypothetical protein ACK5LO_13545 [Leucobacter sp.]
MALSVEAWTPAFAPLKRLTLAPKHHLVDPALAARLVGVEVDGLLVGQGERVRDLVVINTGPYAYRRPDGVAVVPLALLGP